MAVSGFTKEHFELLSLFGGEIWTQSPPEVAAKALLDEAYEATYAWANLVQKKRFPDGYIDGRRDVIVRGRRFSAYTWWRIYPGKESPRQLSYTVGIDKTGDFIVKIDTYDPSALMRARYLQACGRSYATAPFWNTISANEGLAKSQEELIDWSIAAIDSFSPSYETLSHQIIDEMPPALSAVDSLEKLRSHFDGWRRILIENASRIDTTWCVPDADMVFDITRQSRSQFRQLPSGPWVVEINEPNFIESPGSMSTIATDKFGRAYLLRRGLLRTNGPDKGVEEPWFGALSGLPPISISGPERLSRCAWYVVAALSEGDDIAVAMTGQFVQACVSARSNGPGLVKHLRASGPAYTIGSDENGGTYVRRAQDARPEQTVVRAHGDVSAALLSALRNRGLKIEKHRHPLGFEIDGVFKTIGDRQILVEIKTSATGHDIHKAVGQLYLYPALMDHLKSVKRFLLLPFLPDDRIVKAVRHLGIEVFTYQSDSSTPPNITFSEEFLMAVER